MARRRGGSEVTVDIFNFLGVVKNLMGVLMVIIIGLAIGATESGGGGGDGSGSGSGKGSGPTPPPNMAATQAGEDPKQNPSQGQDQSSQSGPYKSDPERDKLAELVMQANIVSQLMKTAKVHSDPSSDVKTLGEENKKLQEEYTKLKALVGDRPLPDDGGKAAAIRITGGTGGSKKVTPCFIECTEYAILIHSVRGSGESSYIGSRQDITVDEKGVERIRVNELETGSRFRVFLNQLQNTSVDCIVFLIRPDGVPTYKIAKRQVKQQAIRSEILAVPGFGPLDLTMFK